MAFNKYLILSVAAISLWWFALAQNAEEVINDVEVNLSSEEAWTNEAWTDEVWADEALIDDSLFDDDLFDDDALFDDTSTDETFSNETENNASTIGWGYAPEHLITVKEQGSDYVILTSPLIFDGNWTQISNYKVVYSTSPVDGTDPLELRDMVFNFEDLTVDATEVDFNLVGLSEGAVYYAVVVPFNKDNVEWDSSQEISFQVGTHNASAAQIKDVSFSVDKWIVTLTWNPEVWTEKVEIFSRSEQETDFTSVWTVNSAAGTYNLTIAQAWNYFVKLIPVNAEWAVAGDEIIQSIKVDEVVVVDAEAPKVWPATNALIALIAFAMLGYVYSRSRRYSK